MALINCPECEARISDKAVSCPHCGYPLASRPQGTAPRAELPFMTPLAQFAELVSRTMSDVLEPLVEESRRKRHPSAPENEKPEDHPKEKE